MNNLGEEGMKIKKIGIIGTGMLGSAVTLHLLESGFKITAYNRTSEKVQMLKDKGAKIADITKGSCGEIQN